MIKKITIKKEELGINPKEIIDVKRVDIFKESIEINFEVKE